MGPFKKVFDFVRNCDGPMSAEFRDLFYIFLCQASYLSSKSLNMLCQQLPDLNNYRVFYTARTVSVLYEFKNFTVLAVRGNVVHSDYLRSLCFYPTTYNGVVAHAGFAKTASELCNTGINTAIREATSRGELIYTGHSSGGAVVSLLATHSAPDTIVTYGSPRVLTLRSENTVFEQVTYRRYFNQYDYVRCLPPTRPFSYEHIGKTICFPSSLNYQSVLKSHAISTYAMNYMEKFGDSLCLQ